MVRVVSASNIGLGDYGCSMSDSEVDGIVWDSQEYPESRRGRSKRRSKKIVKPTPARNVPSKMLGKSLTSSKAQKNG